MNLASFDAEFLIKFLTIVLGGGVLGGLWKYATRNLELKHDKQQKELEAEERRRALADGRPEQLYGAIIDRLNKEIERLRADDEAVAATAATNLMLLRDVTVKNAEVIGKCHEERREMDAEFRKRLRRLIRARKQLEEKVKKMEATATDLAATLETAQKTFDESRERMSGVIALLNERIQQLETFPR